MKKTLTTSIAAIAVAGMIGGGTFADWSSTSDPFENKSGAGILELTVDSVGTKPTEFTTDRMAPGAIGKDTTFQLASSHADSVPNAVLTLKYSDGEHWENGCNGDELTDETNNSDSPLCSTATSAAVAGGQFAENARIKVAAYENVGGGTCSTDVSAYKTIVYNDVPLSTVLGTEITIPPYHATNNPTGITLSTGESACLRSLIHLPFGLDNSMQGDWVDFDLTFVLDQL